MQTTCNAREFKGEQERLTKVLRNITSVQSLKNTACYAVWWRALWASCRQQLVLSAGPWVKVRKFSRELGLWCHEPANGGTNPGTVSWAPLQVHFLRHLGGFFAGELTITHISRKALNVNVNTCRNSTKNFSRKGEVQHIWHPGPFDMGRSDEFKLNYRAEFKRQEDLDERVFIVISPSSRCSSAGL